MEEKKSKLLYALIGTAAILILIYIFKSNINIAMFGGRIPHFWVEFLGGIVACAVAFYCFSKYKKNFDKVYMILGLAFFANGLIDIFHAFVARGVLGIPFSSSEVFIPGTWTAGRLLLGLILCAIFFVKKEERQADKEYAIVDLYKWAGLVAVFTLIITALFVFFELPAVIQPNVPIFTRPWELLPLLLLVIALPKFCKIAMAEKDIFKSFLAASILIGIFAQVYMTGSGSILTEIISGVEKQVFDPLFILSHLIKDLSYLVAAAGILIPKISEKTDTLPKQEIQKEVR